jgi:hypothetical protein
MQIIHVVGRSSKGLFEAMAQAQGFLRETLEAETFDDVAVDHSSGYVPGDGYFVTIIAVLK